MKNERDQLLEHYKRLTDETVKVKEEKEVLTDNLGIKTEELVTVVTKVRDNNNKKNKHLYKHQ